MLEDLGLISTPIGKWKCINFLCESYAYELPMVIASLGSEGSCLVAGVPNPLADGRWPRSGGEWLESGAMWLVTGVGSW